MNTEAQRTEPQLAELLDAQPPCNDDLERELIAMLSLSGEDPRWASEVGFVFAFLEEADFRLEEWARLFTAMKRSHYAGEPFCTAGTLKESLAATQTFGPVAAKLIDAVHSLRTEHAPAWKYRFYCRTLRCLRIKRALVNASEKLLRCAHSKEPEFWVARASAIIEKAKEMQATLALASKGRLTGGVV
jgi:hypothetical protein